MYGLELTHARLKRMKHGVCKAKKEDYTTPTKAKHEMTSPTKNIVVSFQKNTKKKTLRWHPISLFMIAYKLDHV